MRNGTKLKQLLSVCDLNLTMEEDTITITAIHKGTYKTHTREGKTFSAALDKAYRQMLKGASVDYQDE